MKETCVWKQQHQNWGDEYNARELRGPHVKYIEGIDVCYNPAVKLYVYVYMVRTSYITSLCQMMVVELQ